MRVRSCVMGMLVPLLVAIAAGNEVIAQALPSDGAGAPSAAVPMSKLKVGHLKLCGDLDNLRLVRQFADELSRMKQEGAELVVLEMAGDRWRGDVVAEMIKAAASAGVGTSSGSSGVPWMVWLNDPAEGRVGSGQAAIGAAADRCYLGSKTEIVCEPGDEARELAPVSPELNWEQVESEVQGLVWSRLKSRGGELLLASALPTPRQRLWAVRGRGASSDPALRLVADEPEGGAGAVAIVTPVVGAEAGAMRLRLSAADAIGLGLAAGQAKELTQILAARRISPRPLVRREIVSGLGAARERMVRDFAAVDAAREQLDKSMDEAERFRGYDADKKRARAGSDGLALAERAIARLLAVEQLTEEYPELLRGVPPGQSEVGLSEERRAPVWNAAFQSRRQALTDLRNRASRLVQ